jgi:hypothetical protein
VFAFGQEFRAKLAPRNATENAAFLHSVIHLTDPWRTGQKSGMVRSFGCFPVQSEHLRNAI